MLSLNKCINQWCNFVNGWWQMGLALVRRGWGSSVAPVAPAQAKWVEVFGAETPLVFTSWWPLCAALSVLYSFITFLHTPFFKYIFTSWRHLCTSLFDLSSFIFLVCVFHWEFCILWWLLLGFVGQIGCSFHMYRNAPGHPNWIWFWYGL